jgi:hypothetical protein
MSGFANPIIGGQGALVRSQIKSPDFSLPGKTGWAILRDGSAYFFNVTATGLVTANSVIVDGAGQGVFIYDGPAANDNLIVSVASGAGIDPFGNAYSGPGISVSAPGPTGKNEIQIRPDKRAVFIYADS